MWSFIRRPEEHPATEVDMGAFEVAFADEEEGEDKIVHNPNVMFRYPVLLMMIVHV